MSNQNSDTKKAPQISNLGMGFNILKLDPLEQIQPIAGAVILASDEESPYVPTNYIDNEGKTWLGPGNAMIDYIDQTDYESVAHSISNSESYKKTSSTKVSASVGIAGIAKFSASYSHQSSFSSTRSSKHYSFYANTRHYYYSAYLNDFPSPSGFTTDLTGSSNQDSDLKSNLERSNNSEQSSNPIVLAQEFKNDVLKLGTNFDESDAENLKAFKDFIYKYGTHFASSVIFGGVAKISDNFSSSFYQSVASSNTTVSESASATLDDLTVGESSSVNSGHTKKLSSIDSNMSVNLETIGGVGYPGSPSQASFSEWINSVDGLDKTGTQPIENGGPMPVKIHLTEITELLAKPYFDNFNIEGIQNALKQAILYYYYECGTPEVDTSNIVQIYAMNSNDSVDKYKYVLIPLSNDAKGDITSFSEVTNDNSQTGGRENYNYAGDGFLNDGFSSSLAFSTNTLDIYTIKRNVVGNKVTYEKSDIPVQIRLVPVYGIQIRNNFYLYQVPNKRGESGQDETDTADLARWEFLPGAKPLFYSLPDVNSEQSELVQKFLNLNTTTLYQYVDFKTNSCYLNTNSNNWPGNSGRGYKFNTYNDISLPVKQSYDKFFAKQM